MGHPKKMGKILSSSDPHCHAQPKLDPNKLEPDTEHGETLQKLHRQETPNSVCVCEDNV